MKSDYDLLLETVIKFPEEDCPRLVLADWIEEHGEHDRAELIRLQCEIERLPQFDGVQMIGGFEITSSQEVGKVTGVVSQKDAERAKQHKTSLRFGEYECVAMLERASSSQYQLRERIVDVTFVLLPTVEDGQVVLFKKHNDRRDILSKRTTELFTANPEWGNVLAEIFIGKDRQPLKARTDYGYGGCRGSDRRRWSWTRGFISQLECSWEDWSAHSAAVCKVAPIEKCHLLTTPSVNQWCSSEQWVTLWGYDKRIKCHVPNSAPPVLDVLKAEWAGVTFTLPNPDVVSVPRNYFRENL